MSFEENLFGKFNEAAEKIRNTIEEQAQEDAERRKQKALDLREEKIRVRERLGVVQSISLATRQFLLENDLFPQDKLAVYSKHHNLLVRLASDGHYSNRPVWFISYKEGMTDDLNSGSMTTSTSRFFQDGVAIDLEGNTHVFTNRSKRFHNLASVAMLSAEGAVTSNPNKIVGATSDWENLVQNYVALRLNDLPTPGHMPGERLYHR